MSNGKMKFWITCPSCRLKFGVEPRTVMKYIERVIDQHEHQIDAMKDILASAQRQVDEAAGESKKRE